MEELYSAINAKNLELVKSLVESHGVEIITENAVYMAVLSNDLGIVKYLVENGGKIPYGAVHKAISNNNTAMVEYLVEKGGEFSDYDVFQAISENDLGIVKYLVEKGGEIPYYAVSAAVSNKNAAMVEYLVEKGGKISNYSVFQAISENDLGIVKYLVEKCGEIHDGAVSQAVFDNNTAVVEYLVEKGGEFSDADVLRAISNNNTAIVECLVRNGGKFSDDDVSEAISDNNTAMVECLVQNGGKIPDDAVSKAISNNNTEMVKYLVEKGAKIFAKDMSQVIAKINAECAEFVIANCEDCVATIPIYRQFPDLFAKMVKAGVAIAPEVKAHATLHDDTNLLRILGLKNDFNHQEIDASPLTVMQNGLDTMVRMKDGRVNIFKNSNAADMYKKLSGEADLDILEIYFDKGHGFIGLHCKLCNEVEGHHDFYGLYPSGIMLENKDSVSQYTKLEFYINQEQSGYVMQFIKEALNDCENGRKDMSQYVADSHNCVDFAQNAYEAAGFKGDFADFITDAQLDMADVWLNHEKQPS